MEQENRLKMKRGSERVERVLEERQKTVRIKNKQAKERAERAELNYQMLQQSKWDQLQQT